MQITRYESPHDKRVDLYIFTANYKKDFIVTPHFHRSFEILYILEGSLTGTVGGQTFTATADDIVFVQKYYCHEYTALSDYKKYVLIIPPHIYNDFENIMSHNTLPAILNDKQFNRTLLPFFKSLHDEKNLSTLIKKGYADIIMGKFISHYPLQPIERNSNIDLLVNILNFIDDNYEKNLSLEYISERFGYNKYYFSKLFNKTVGVNINSYINLIRLQRLMEKARKSGGDNITDLAFECGFDSLSTFYRCFHKTYGATPKEILSKSK